MAHAGEHGHPQSTGPIIQTGQLSDYVPSFEKFVGIAVPHKDPLMNFFRPNDLSVHSYFKIVVGFTFQNFVFCWNNEFTFVYCFWAMARKVNTCEPFSFLWLICGFLYLFLVLFPLRPLFDPQKVVLQLLVLICRWCCYLVWRLPGAAKKRYDNQDETMCGGVTGCFALLKCNRKI